MAPRTKAPEGTSNEVKLAEAILNHRNKIVELTARVKLIETDNESAFAALQHTNAALIERLDALEANVAAVEAHVATLTATSINAARNTSSAPRWYRAWMGGLALGLLLVILFAMQISSQRSLAAYRTLQDERRQDAVARMARMDSVVNGLCEKQGVAPVRSSKRNRPLVVDVVDAGATADASTAPAAVPAGTDVVGGTR